MKLTDLQHECDRAYKAGFDNGVRCTEALITRLLAGETVTPETLHHGLAATTPAVWRQLALVVAIFHHPPEPPS